MTDRKKIPMQVVSKMSREQFVAVLGSVFEQSPWVAERAWEARPFHKREELHKAMMSVVEQSSDEEVIAFLLGHPDLGTRFSMGANSTAEQQGAGLDRLSPDQYERLSEMNRAYAEKFGFPFIMAVRGNTKEDILASLAVRIENDGEREKRTALAEIRKITGFRLADLMEP